MNKKVTEYIKKQDEWKQEIIDELREIILEHKDIEEMVKWNIPFYTYKGILLYINAAKNYVTLGFCWGVLLPDEQKIFLEGNGKQIRLLRFITLKDVKREVVKKLIRQAMKINDDRKLSRKTIASN